MKLITTLLLVMLYYLIVRIALGWFFHDTDKEAMFMASLSYITLLIYIIRKR